MTDTVRSLHDSAMGETMKAYALYLSGRDLSNQDRDEMFACLHRSYEYENRAIATLVEVAESEGIDASERNPTEQILRRSAMSILYRAVKYMEAVEEWEAQHE